MKQSLTVQFSLLLLLGSRGMAQDPADCSLMQMSFKSAPVPDEEGAMPDEEGIQDDEWYDLDSSVNTSVKGGRAVPDNEVLAFPTVLKSTIIRFSYRCHGDVYAKWLSKHRAEIESMDRSMKDNPIKHDVLLVGNSHTREIGEALFNMHLDHAKEFDALDTSCNLRPKNVSETCNGYHTTCYTELSVMKLDNNARIMVGSNNKMFHYGENGLDSLMRVFGVEPTKLKYIVVGKFNAWPETFYGDTLLGGPSINVDDPMHSCKADKWLRGVPYVASMNMSTVANYLHDRGFSGTLIVGGHLGGDASYQMIKHLPERSKDDSPFRFQVKVLSRLLKIVGAKSCAPHDCHPNIYPVSGEHQCIPGPPNYAAFDIHQIVNSLQ